MMVSDSPKETRTEDKLAYCQFAVALAKGLLGSNPENGLTVALYGQWGIGKTTILNFIKEYIKAENSSNVKIIDFNPWWFSGREQLARDLITTICDAVSPLMTESKQLKDSMVKYADAISKTVNILPVGVLFKSLLGIMGSACKTAFADNNIAKLKSDVCAELSRCTDKWNNFKAIVFIDDIDRLRPDEIVELFTVIRALANFPNVVYVMAMDRAVVTQGISNALFSGDTRLGVQFLEKIVQVEFKVPIVRYSNLSSMLEDSIYRVIPKEEFRAPKHWKELFDAISHVFKTPREVVRFENSLSVTYPSVKNIVCYADFVALESIRLLAPLLYDEIVNKLHILVYSGVDVVGLHIDKDSSKDCLSEICEKCINEKNFTLTKEQIELLLPLLFPKLDAYEHIHEEKIEWDNDCRVCCYNYYPSYFMFSPQPEAVSIDAIKKELTDIEESKTHIDTYIEYTLQISTSERFETICNAIEANADILSKKTVEESIKHLLTCNDALLWKIWHKKFHASKNIDTQDYFLIIFRMLNALALSKGINVEKIISDLLNSKAENLSYATIAICIPKYFVALNQDFLSFVKNKILSELKEHPDVKLPFAADILVWLYMETNEKEVLSDFVKKQMEGGDEEVINLLASFMAIGQLDYDTTSLSIGYAAKIIDVLFDCHTTIERLQKIRTRDDLLEVDKLVVKKAYEHFNDVEKFGLLQNSEIRQ